MFSITLKLNFSAMSAKDNNNHGSNDFN